MVLGDQVSFAEMETQKECRFGGVQGDGACGFSGWRHQLVGTQIYLRGFAGDFWVGYIYLGILPGTNPDLSKPFNRGTWLVGSVG